MTAIKLEMNIDEMLLMTCDSPEKLMTGIIESLTRKGFELGMQLHWYREHSVWKNDRDLTRTVRMIALPRNAPQLEGMSELEASQYLRKELEALNPDQQRAISAQSID